MIVFLAEKESLETVLSSDTPKNFPKRKFYSDMEVPDVASHFDPIYNDLRNIFDPPETTLTPVEKEKILAEAIKNTDNKKKLAKRLGQDYYQDEYTKVAISPKTQANKAMVQILGGYK